jgi:hypothetical protein
MTHRSLRIAAARHVLGLAVTADLIDAADAALTDGVYSYSLGELGTARDPRLEDARKLFRAALEELDTPVPSPEEAIITILEFHAAAIAEGAVDPLAGVQDLYDVYRKLDWFRTPKLVDVPEAFHQLIAYHYRHEEHIGYGAYHLEAFGTPADEQPVEELKRECLRFAEQWCRHWWSSHFEPAWRSPDVVALAKGIYEERAFDRLPILADALQDAGCDCDDILDHCRGSVPHVRGCWVVDLILGKS